MQALRALRARSASDLIFWGSSTLCDALLRAGQVDVLRLRIGPVLIGRGRSFTPGDLGARRLSLVSAGSFFGGHALLEYAIDHWNPRERAAPKSATGKYARAHEAIDIDRAVKLPAAFTA